MRANKFVFELIQLDTVPDLTYDTKRLLLKDAANGFFSEATSLLQLALKHAPNEQKANLMAQLTKLARKLQEPPLIPDEVANAWWKLFEPSLHKAARTTDAEKSLKQWLRRLYIENPDTAFI